MQASIPLRCGVLAHRCQWLHPAHGIRGQRGVAVSRGETQTWSLAVNVGNAQTPAYCPHGCAIVKVWTRRTKELIRKNWQKKVGISLCNGITYGEDHSWIEDGTGFLCRNNWIPKGACLPVARKPCTAPHTVVKPDPEALAVHSSLYQA